MRCQSCGTYPISVDARFCHKCGKELVPATQIKIDQQVEHNLGQVIGVQTGAIHGNVYGGDIYEVQVFALTAQGRKEDWNHFVEKGTLPYRYLSPYRVQDRAIFMGRKRESLQLLQYIGQQQLVVLYGQPGVGKTSLIASGVIPDLMENGAMVLHIHDCLNPVKSIQAALTSSAQQLPLISSNALTLPELVKEIVVILEGSLILVFDQFERLFEPSVDVDTRVAVVESLSQSLQEIPYENYRVVIVVQEPALGQLIAMGDRLPELGRLHFNLQPLNPQQAAEAIAGPLMVLNYPVSYVGDLVRKHLIPDLDNLSESPGIHPPHLQIVCHWLYLAARDLQPPHIDEKLYFNAKAADGIIARHFEEILRTRFGDDRRLAEQILLYVTSKVIEHWTPQKLLPRDGVSAEKMNHVLNQMVDEELLVKRSSNGSIEYALTSAVLGEVIPVLAGSQADNQLRSEQELERIWTAWLARGVPATKGQLHFLEQVGDQLQLDAVRALLLLHSAVVRDMPAGPWVNRLKTDQGRALMRHLEGLPNGEEESFSSQSNRNKAELLLNLRDHIQMQASPGGGELFGPVSMTAVKSVEPVHRHTAALALSVVGSQLAIGRLDLALRAALHGRPFRLRAAELRGVLADADPEIEDLFSHLPAAERLAIWGWRARRRLIQNRDHIFWLTLGGAFGASLSLGLLRAIIAIMAERTLVGAQFANYAFSGWILGAALSFGIVIVKPLLFGGHSKREKLPSIWGISLNPERLAAVTGILSGTLFFWLGHAVVLAFSSLSPLENIFDILRAGTVILAGLGLSFALFDQPWAARAAGLKKWLRQPMTLLRIGIASMAILLGEIVFGLSRDGVNSLAISWGRDFYKSAFFNLANERFPQIAQSVPNWSTILAFIDAALVGILMTVGISSGLYLALSWLTRWRELNNRLVD